MDTSSTTTNALADQTQSTARRSTRSRKKTSRMAEYENMLGEDDSDEDLNDEVENDVNVVNEVVNKKKKRKITAVQLEEEDEVFTTNDPSSVQVDSYNPSTPPDPSCADELPELPEHSGGHKVTAVEQVAELTAVEDDQLIAKDPPVPEERKTDEKTNGSGSDGRIDAETDRLV